MIQFYDRILFRWLLPASFGNGVFPWRFVDGESSIARCVAIVDDKEYAYLMKKKEAMPKTKFGDAIDPSHVDSINKLSKANLS